eukprot:3142557-Pyramimonas_sp.AAC.1
MRFKEIHDLAASVISSATATCVKRFPSSARPIAAPHPRRCHGASTSPSTCAIARLNSTGESGSP